MRRGAVAAAGLGLMLAGCGQSVVLPGPTAQTVAHAVAARTGYRPPDVHCPSGVPAKVGRSFTCRFTGPDGKYRAVLRITSVHGHRVTYAIRTERTDRTILVTAAENEVADFVFSHAHVRPTNVTCPAGVLAEVGAHYQCHFTGPDGSYTADVTITSVHGSSVSSHIVSRRTGP